jgi:CheY-like chemotaxis protein
MKLPCYSGIDILRQIKTDPDVSTIPVIVYTTSMNQYDIKKSLELGAIDYIIKPIRCSILLEKLKRAHYR